MSARDKWVVWLAEGCGAGRIPFGPGTWGSVVGVIWFLLLTRLGSLTLFWLGLVVGVAGSVVICGAAERITGRKDPGSVVLDEIVAVPICFVPWLLAEHLRLGAMPPAESFVGSGTWGMTVILFALFRVFDIWKPWPIGSSQRLPGGWGVTADDVLAALAVAGLSWLAMA
jgi:phosphatidylglycerophosphatase A